MVHNVKNSGDFYVQLVSAGERLVVVDFFATWCGPCKEIAPKVVAMSKDMDDVVFLKVDVDKVEDVAEDNGVKEIPTFVLYKRGQKVVRMTGANESRLKTMINKHR